MTHDNMYRAVQRSEEEAVQMEPFSDDGKRHGQGDSQDIGECDENDKLIMCRICYDDDKKENTVSPCHCVGSHAHVHVTCLEQWLSVSKSSSCDICSYTFKTIERSLTLREWLRERRTCQGFCQQFTVVLFFIAIWGIVLISCGLKTIEYFLDTNDNNSVSNGFLMAIITFTMAPMLWFWLWLRERRTCKGFCQQFTVMFFFVAIWGLVLIACGLKTIEYFLDTNDKNSVSNGFLMSIITFAMAAMLWFWLVIFSSIWKRMNMVIRLDKNYLNGVDDINDAFAV